MTSAVSTVSVVNPLGTVSTFFQLPDACEWQRYLASRGYNARLRITGRESYTVHVLNRFYV